MDTFLDTMFELLDDEEETEMFVTSLEPAQGGGFMVVLADKAKKAWATVVKSLGEAVKVIEYMLKAIAG